MVSTLATITNPELKRRTWATVKVIEPFLARRFIRRLDALGFEYQVILENRHLRILVRDKCLNEVMEWFRDLSDSRTLKEKANTNKSHSTVGLLIALPTGMLVGSVFSKLVGIPSPFAQSISGYFGFAAALTAYVIIASRTSHSSNTESNRVVDTLLRNASRKPAQYSNLQRLSDFSTGDAHWGLLDFFDRHPFQYFGRSF